MAALPLTPTATGSGRVLAAMQQVVLRRVAAAAALAAVVSVGPALGARQIPPYGGAQAYRADLAARRERAMAALGTDAILVLRSAPPRVYSADTNYEYRQESNLLYLTGIEQEDTVLVLVPGAKTRKEIVFARAADPRQELWFGHVMTPAELTATSGIADVVTERRTDALDGFLDGLLRGRVNGMSPASAEEEFGAFFRALRAGRARVATLSSATPGEGDTAEAEASAARASRAPVAGVTSVSAVGLLDKLREIKTPYEQAVLRRSAEISAQAHVRGMRATRPGRWEYEVEAAVEYWYLKNGALSWGYPSIVASGPNATTLHYLSSTRQLQAGDLLLVDAAANFQGLTGDITRTYPVSGRFSNEQRAIYELVLKAQNAGLAAARPGSAVGDIDRAVRGVFAAGLAELGLITDGADGADSAQVSWWFPHGPTHGIGVDVHDPLGALDPGAAFVIEPGLYIRPDVLEQLPRTPENVTAIAKIRPAVARYRNIGVRIEDSFLMTAKGPECLSAGAPKEIRELERIVGKGAKDP